MSLGNEIGFAAEKTTLDWFAPMPGAIIAELNEDVSDAARIGATTAEKTIILGADSASYARACRAERRRARRGLSYQDREDRHGGAVLLRGGDARLSAIKLARPKALIPVFPGTNCEYDTKRALMEAGAGRRTLHHPQPHKRRRCR